MNIVEIREAREKMIAAQPQRKAPIESVPSTSRKSGKRIPETTATTPKYKPAVLESGTVPPTRTAGRSDPQTEARTKAQAEFQARMKARLEAQATASANRQRELEHAVALEDARRKAQRTEIGEGSITPTHPTTYTPRARIDTLSPAHRTSYNATNPDTLPPALTSESVVHRYSSGWRSRNSAMTRSGGSTTPITRPDPQPFNDSSGIPGRPSKSPQVPVTPVPHVGQSTPAIRAGSFQDAMPTTPRADNASARAGWRQKQLINSSAVTTKVSSDSRGVTPVVRHVNSTTHKVWRARETKG